MQEVKGNLIEMALAGEFDVIAHGCNCFSLQGAGIAKSMSETFQTNRFPLELKGKGSFDKLGRIDFKKIGIWRKPIKNFIGHDPSWGYGNYKELLTVVNCYTQYKPGANLDYQALILCFKKLNHKFRNKHLGLPHIGCGIAGGDIDDVRKLIKQYLTDVKVTLVEYDNA